MLVKIFISSEFIPYLPKPHVIACSRKVNLPAFSSVHKGCPQMLYQNHLQKSTSPKGLKKEAMGITEIIL